MSLLELKLTLLEDYCKKNEDRWHCEYIREYWKSDLDKIKLDLDKSGGVK